MTNWKFGRTELGMLGIFLLGVFLRVYHLFFTGISYPYSLGALYLEFAEQIAKNSFLFPNVIHHYLSDPIPFVYPPLAFYIQAVLIYLFKLPQFAVNNTLPVVFSVFSMVAFAKLVYGFSQKPAVRMATFALWSLLPVLFQNTLSGAGVAEGLGSLFTILLLDQLQNLQNGSTNQRTQVFAGVFLGLAILSAPGSALAAPILTVLFLFAQYFTQRSDLKQSITRAAILFGCMLLVTAPYIYNVLFIHRLSDLLASLQYQLANTNESGSRLARWYQLASHTNEFSFSSVFYPIVLLLGLAWLAHKKNALWLIASILFLIVPRENTWLFHIPEVILFATGCQALFSLLPLQKSTIQRVVLTGLVLLSLNTLFWLSYRYIKRTDQFKAETVTAEDIAAMQYLQQNSDPNSYMVVLTKDTTAEYFPHISKRTMLNSNWGSEFALAHPNNRLDKRQLDQCQTIACIDQMVASLDVDVHEYYIISNLPDKLAFLSAEEVVRPTEHYILTLRQLRP